MENKEKLRILTYNVNFGSFVDTSLPCAQAREVCRAIYESNAHIVCLQETNEGWQNFLCAELTEKYPEQLWESPESTGYFAAGSALLLSPQVSVLRRGEIVSMRAEMLKLSGSFFPQQYALVQFQGKLLGVANLHLRPPLAMGEAAEARGWGMLKANAKAYLFEASTIHAQEVEAVLRLLSELSVEFGVENTRLVVAGDFNEGSGGALAFLKRKGMANALDCVKGDKTTWYWPLKWGLSLWGSYDHIFFSSASSENKKVNDRFKINNSSDSVVICDNSEVQGQGYMTCVNCSISRQFKHASDHVPVLATFLI